MELGLTPQEILWWVGQQTARELGERRDRLSEEEEKESGPLGTFFGTTSGSLNWRNSFGRERTEPKRSA